MATINILTIKRMCDNMGIEVANFLATVFCCSKINQSTGFGLAMDFYLHAKRATETVAYGVWRLPALRANKSPFFILPKGSRQMKTNATKGTAHKSPRGQHVFDSKKFDRQIDALRKQIFSVEMDDEVFTLVELLFFALWYFVKSKAKKQANINVVEG